MNRGNLPPAWVSALERLKSRRSSPILMPTAVLAVLDLAEQGRCKDGRVVIVDYEESFTRVMGTFQAAKTAEGWRPFYHLSGGVGLWTLWKGEHIADFSDLRKGKPASRASLVSRADHARIKEELVADMQRPQVRKQLKERITELIAG